MRVTGERSKIAAPEAPRPQQSNTGSVWIELRIPVCANGAEAGNACLATERPSGQPLGVEPCFDPAPLFDAKRRAASAVAA